MVALAAWCVAPLSAQEGTLAVSGQGFAFGDPAGVGPRSYRVLATTLGVAMPVRPWLVAGTTIQYATASLASWSEHGIGLSGATDADVFAEALVGRLRVRGVFVLGTGASTFDSGEMVVAGLAGYELLPMAVRGWGRGGGYALKARLPLRAAGVDIELLGARRSHGGFTPLESESFEYRLGSETRLGIRFGRTRTALSRVEIGGQVVMPSSDEADRRPVFTSGTRIVVFGLHAFPIGQTNVLLRADLYKRYRGVPNNPPMEPSIVRLTGTSDWNVRELAALAIETRTVAGPLPIMTSVRARGMRDGGGSGRGWLLSAGLSTQYATNGPWPGRLFLVPGGRVHGGHVTVAEGYGSSITGWELSIEARWEAGR